MTKGENDMERNLLISLVTKAQNGDVAAMNELFTSFYNDIVAFLDVFKSLRAIG